MSPTLLVNLSVLWASNLLSKGGTARTGMNSRKIVNSIRSDSNLSAS